jgi:hypothetical protein
MLKINHPFPQWQQASKMTEKEKRGEERNIFLLLMGSP